MVHAESRVITCVQSMNNGVIHIEGQISNVISSNQVTLIVGEDVDNITDENIAYISQTTSTYEGYFEFNFTLPNTDVETVYEYKIGSDSDAVPYTGGLNLNDLGTETPIDRTIICTEEYNGNEIIIRGKISNVTTTNQVTLIVSNDIDNITDENITYISQTTSSNDGTFEFSFPINGAVAGESYGYRVGSDAGAGVYTDVITIAPNVETVQRQFIDADVNVNIVNYVPSVSGTITCAEGKIATINILNITDNTVVANDILTEGMHNISYQLPSLVTAKEYLMTVIGSDTIQDLAVLNVSIDSSVLLVTISGSVNISDGVSMDVAVESNNTSLIDKSTTITKDRSLSATIPNIVSNASYHLTATGYETATVVIPDEEEISAEYIISGNAGDSFKVTAAATNIISFDEVFTLEYNAEQITPVSLYGAYYEDSLQLGIRGDVEIISYAPGMIRFKKVNRQTINEQIWSGVLNIFKFRFNDNYSGETTIILYN